MLTYSRVNLGQKKNSLKHLDLHHCESETRWKESEKKREVTIRGGGSDYQQQQQQQHSLFPKQVGVR